MVQLRVLGDIDLRFSDGRTARQVLSQPRRFALLVYLALQPGEFVRRDSLLALFWPESDTARARGALRNALHFLRQALGDDVIAARGAEEIGISRSELSCDAVDFRDRLENRDFAAALALYRGDLLNGFHISDAEEWEQWLEGERSKLHSAARSAALAMENSPEALENPVIAARYARHSVDLEWNDEPAVSRLIEALERAGDRRGALAAYEQYARRLERELGAQPSSRIRRIVEELRAAPPPPATAPPPAIAPPPKAFAPPPLIEASVAAAPTGDVVPTGIEPRPTPSEPITATNSQPVSRRGFPRPVWYALAVVAAVAVVAVSTTRYRSQAAESSNDVLAVLPFDYQGGPAYAYLGDGIVRLLSTNLDGAGSVRTVDPRALFATLTSSDDAASRLEQGQAVAKRFGAAGVVIGHITEAGGRLRISATLYQRGDPSQRSEEITVEGTGDELFDLVDRLTARLIAVRSGAPAQRITQLAALTTTSLPALKAFLEGERDYQNARYEAAVESFRRAIAADSTFALAYYRMSAAGVWTGGGDPEWKGREGAMRFRGRLAPRDRALVEAWQRQFVERTADAAPLYEAIVAKYPDDVEAWFQLAEARFHWKPVFGHSLTASRSAFERVIAFEPNNAAALIHLARIAALERDRPRMDTIFARLRGSTPDVERSLELAVLHTAVATDAAERDRMLAQLRSTEPDVRLRLVNSLALYVNDFAGAVAVVRPLIGEAENDSRRAQALNLVAELEAARGRFTAAFGELDALRRIEPGTETRMRAAFTSFPFAQRTQSNLDSAHSRLAAASPDTMGAGLRGPARLYLMARLEALKGEMLPALGRAAALGRMRDTSGAKSGDPLAEIVRSDVARKGRHLDEALRQLGSPRYLRDYQNAGLSSANADARWLRAELLNELGRPEEALRWYSSFPDPAGYFYDLIYLAPSHFRRAQLMEKAGNQKAARFHYAQFAAIWKDADPELRASIGTAWE